ncbi:hypothetical protein GGR50DRAFT_695801 [Xylaria sp. CBS 124048]|nr:hypothetical protein GGR50DRAFT_695801 [Xylaria sp. CBS 124048]
MSSEEAIERQLVTKEDRKAKALGVFTKAMSNAEAGLEPVEALFADFKIPETNHSPDSINITAILQKFVKTKTSTDPDYGYLMTLAKRALEVQSYDDPSGYFRRRLGTYAVGKPPSRKDKSQKAKQFRYHRWMVQGAKAETFPFSEGKPPGPPSTTRIASLLTGADCAACGKAGSANLRCSDCTFSGDEFILNKTAYCNKQCLQEHAQKHKFICESRTMLYRAVQLITSISDQVHAATYANPIRHVEEKDGILWVESDRFKRASMTGRMLFAPYPKRLHPSEEIVKTLVSRGQSEELTLCLFILIDYCLRPVCRKVELVCALPRNAIRPLCHIDDTKVEMGNSSGRIHKLLKLTLYSNEVYAFDIGGDQLGWKEKLVPWTIWSDLRTLRVTDVEVLKGRRSARSRSSPPDGTTVAGRLRDSARFKMINSIVIEIGLITGCTAGRQTFKAVLKSKPAEYAQVLASILAMSRREVFSIAGQNKYRVRLVMGPGPDFRFRIACTHKDYKEVWMTPKEYDGLQQTGINMLQFWENRLKVRSFVIACAECGDKLTSEEEKIDKLTLEERVRLAREYHAKARQNQADQDNAGQSSASQDKKGQGKARQNQADQDNAGQSSASQDKTGQGKTGQDKARQNQADQDNAGQSSASQDKTGQDKTGQDKTGQDKTGQDKTGQDKTGQDKPGQDKPGQAKTGQDKAA